MRKNIGNNLTDIVNHLENEVHVRLSLKEPWLITLSIDRVQVDFELLKKEAEKLGFIFEMNMSWANHNVIRLWKNKVNPTIGEIVTYNLVS